MDMSATINHEVLPVGSDPELRVVQNLLRTSLYKDRTRPDHGHLANTTMASLLSELNRFGLNPSPNVIGGLADLVGTMEAIADRTSPDTFFLSSLAPGAGKTTALINFIKQTFRSLDHEDVSFLVCLSRKDEIRRLVEQIGLTTSDFAVLTSDPVVNGLSTTPPQQARVLFTTHEMVKRRCASVQGFTGAEALYYRGDLRTVRLWDETAMPGEVVALSTDNLATLWQPLRSQQRNLVPAIERLMEAMKSAELNQVFRVPDIEEETGVSLRTAQEGQHNDIKKLLENLYLHSGTSVRLFRLDRRSTVITALDTRETLPGDLAPMVILDASGGVKHTYKLWENSKRGFARPLVRLKDAELDYGNLTIHVLEGGGSKATWQSKGGDLASEVAAMIGTRPEEPWLVVHHKNVCGGKIPSMIRSRIDTTATDIKFLNWGKHQGTNDYRDIKNVILAGTMFYPEAVYEFMARSCANIPIEDEVQQDLIDRVKAGVHADHILQGLSRSSVRKGDGATCGECNAFIIVSKASGIKHQLRTIFPGCVVKEWKRVGKKKLKGKVADALGHIGKFFADNPGMPLPMTELKEALNMTDKANLNRTIRKHPSFILGLEKLEVAEAALGGSKHQNAFVPLDYEFDPDFDDVPDWATI